jgi:bacterioferritin
LSEQAKRTAGGTMEEGVTMSFLSRIREIRERARQQIASGAVTQDYRLDRDQAVGILNEALATELVCVLRYRFHYFMATGIHSQAVKEEFREHAAEEQEHADRIAERIKQLGGKPRMNPAELTGLAHSEYKEGTSLTDMIREDLVAERIAIESYREMIRFFGQQDSTSRRMLEEILAKEEEHADELTDLLFQQESKSAEAPRQTPSQVQSQSIFETTGSPLPANPRNRSKH